MIKHAISKIEWALNYYIAQSRQKSDSWVRVPVGVRRDVVGKATSGRRSLGNPDGVWEPEKLLIRCSRAPSRVDPRASGWASGERERHNVDGHKSGGQNITVSVRSPTPSHTQTLSNPFRTLAIKWEVHIFIKKSSCVCYSLRQYVSCMDMYMRMQHIVFYSEYTNNLWSEFSPIFLLTHWDFEAQIYFIKVFFLRSWFITKYFFLYIYSITTINIASIFYYI